MCHVMVAHTLPLRYHANIQDLNRAVVTRPKPAHLVHLLNGTVEGDVTVLLVRVVEAGPGHVPNPNAEVLDRGRVLLEDLGSRQGTQGQMWVGLSVVAVFGGCEVWLPGLALVPFITSLRRTLC